MPHYYESHVHWLIVDFFLVEQREMFHEFNWREGVVHLTYANFSKCEFAENVWLGVGARLLTFRLARPLAESQPIEDKKEDLSGDTVDPSN